MQNKNINIAPVRVSDVDQAYAWHSETTEHNLSVVTRPFADFITFSESDCLIAAVDGHGKYQGLVFLREKGDSLELSGLTVAPDLQRIGLGKTLAKVAFCLLVAQFQEKVEPSQIIARVNTANRMAPVSLLQQFGFSYDESVSIISSDGSVKIINTYRFKDKLKARALLVWLENFDGQLRDGYRCDLRHPLFSSFLDLSLVFHDFLRNG